MIHPLQAFPAVTVGICCMLSSTGCADFVAAREARSQGWREAKVVQIGQGAEINGFSFTDCRKGLDPQKAASENFVVYRYIALGRPAHHIGTLPNRPVSAGEKVSINIERCDLDPVVR